MGRIYLDYAAATPVDKRVVEAMMPYFADIYYNPSALYLGARQASKAIEEARAQTAKLIGARPAEVVFTAGGTESDNAAIHGVMQANPGGELIVSSIEHEAILRPAENYKVRLAPVNEKGRVDIDKLSALISENTVLISVMLANNEIGSTQPIREIVEIVRKVRIERQKSGNKRPFYVHTDACQAPLYLDIHTSRLGVDMMTLNGGKIYGPKQSGILYIKAGVVLKPLISGGGQEWGMRSGTENVAFAVGFARALELSNRGKDVRVNKVSKLRDYFMCELENRFGAEISGHRKHRIANNINAMFPGADNERVLFALDDLGIDAAAGSACSASQEVSSHVLKAMNKSDKHARSSLRFSISKDTSKKDIDQTLTALETALKA